MNGPTLGAVFPSDIDELTPAILGAALADRHPGVVVDYVEIVAEKRCGDGVARGFARQPRLLPDARRAASRGGARLPTRDRGGPPS